jgi:endonuclease/exonuclease/phosphatase family metal-dependent hydrolase
MIRARVSLVFGAAVVALGGVLAAGCAGAGSAAALALDAGGEVLFGEDAGPRTPPDDAGPLATVDAADAGAPGPATLRVGTWNVARLGQENKRIDLVARAIEGNLDVVGIVEAMNPLGIQQVLAQLPGWTATISERAIGEGSFAEFYAVLVRRGAATVRSSRIVEDTANEWVREPVVTCLVARGLDFCLVQTHVVFGSTVGPRDLEIQALARLVGRMRAADPSERDLIVLGDFNRPGSAPSFASFTSIGYRFSGDGLTKTTIGPSGYVNAYDHVLLDPAATREWLGDSVLVDIVTGVCGGSFSFCASSVSDHAPLAITLVNTGTDDD